MTTPAAIERVPSDLAVATAWTPEALQEEVEREKALRVVVIDYYQSQLRAGHHYYNLPGQEKRKPALAKEGALNLCSLFKVVPEPAEPHETLETNGHYTVRYRYSLRAVRTGQIVATGDGSCSTREAKYAYRWSWERDVPKGIDKDALQERRLKTRNGWATQYRLPTVDLADTYNTVLKMASKRALVDAALKLPLVSELFTQDLEEQITERATEIEPDNGGEPQEMPGATPPGALPPLKHLRTAMERAGITESQALLVARQLFGKSVTAIPQLTDEQIDKLIGEIEHAPVGTKP